MEVYTYGDSLIDAVTICKALRETSDYATEKLALRLRALWLSGCDREQPMGRENGVRLME